MSLKTYCFKFCLQKPNSRINYKVDIAVKLEGVAKQILIFTH